jgi:rare lipoprotein A
MKYTKFFKMALLVMATLFLSAALPKSVNATTEKSTYATVSYYGNGGPHECGKNRPCHGAKTACGNRFDKNTPSAASKTLPCGTKVQFCHAGTCVVAPVNDRGPFVEGRSFDLSVAAAAQIGIVKYGVAKVTVTIID